MANAVRSALDWHRPLTALAAAMGLTGLVSTLGYLVDDRVLAGAPIWAKPLQFSISFAVYAVTLAWLISRLQGARLRHLAHRAGTVIAVATGLEMTAVVVQVLRGRQSHFNYASGVDAAIFGGMGVLVVVIVTATVVVGIALLREPVRDPATTRAVRLGLFIGVAGMCVGFLMVVPRPSQGAGAAIRGGHAVGVADGGPGLPLVGWSTTGGDLRVPHFVGLHALQVLPLLALALAALPVAGRLMPLTRARLVLVGASGYLGLFALSLWQALRGQALTSPDGWTLAALGALVLTVVGVSALVVRADGRCAVTASLRQTVDECRM